MRKERHLHKNKSHNTFLISAVLLLGFLVTGCSLIKPVSFENQDKIPTEIPGNQGTPAAVPDKTGEPAAPSRTPEAKPTEPAGTETTPAAGSETVSTVPESDGGRKPTEKPTADITPTAAPTLTPVEVLTGAKAKEKLEALVGTAYTVSAPETTSVNGDEYFLFTVSDAERIYTPDILIHAKSGIVYYYYSSDEVTELISFPPDNLEQGGTESTEFTTEDAVALLKTLDNETLALPAAITEYKLSADAWTTMVKGKECYCINVYSELENRNQLMGVYYIAIDGSSVYRFESGDFILIY